MDKRNDPKYRLEHLPWWSSTGRTVLHYCDMCVGVFRLCVFSVCFGVLVFVCLLAQMRIGLQVHAPPQILLLQRAATRVFWYCMFVYKSSQIAKPFSRPMSESMVPSIKAAWIKEPDNKDSQLLAQQHFHRACRKFNSGGPVSLQIAKATNVKIRAIHWHYVSTLQHGDVVKRLGNLVASLSVKFIAWARKCTLGRDNLKSYTPRKWKALNHWRAFWGPVWLPRSFNCAWSHAHVSVWHVGIFDLFRLVLRFIVQVPWSRKMTNHVHFLCSYEHPPNCTFFRYGRVQSFGPCAK